ncbi:MAG: hypothetical protein M3N91_14255 [Pseudomonadota bacterium]|nr:hypothetical protein [Pseudomonadota bacterium]
MATSAALTDKDTILLADIVNNTGDDEFDEALEQPLRVALEESPFLDVRPQSRVIAALYNMARPTNVPVKPGAPAVEANSLM